MACAGSAARATPSCSSGVPVGSGRSRSGTEWSGDLHVQPAGQSTSFYCTVHGAEMTGDGSRSAAKRCRPRPTTTATTPETPPSSAGPAEARRLLRRPARLTSPLLGSAAQAVKLPASQHGRSVRGSVKVSQAGAGGRLEVDAARQARVAGGRGHGAQLQVGRLVQPLSAGTVSFKVPLSARAARAARTRQASAERQVCSARRA